MSVIDLLSLIVSCMWMPISINILVDKKLGVKRRVICAILESVAFSTTLIVEYSEIAALWFFPLCFLIVYFGMGKSKKQLLYVPIAYIIVVISNYLVEWMFEMGQVTNRRIAGSLLLMPTLLLAITVVVMIFSYLFKKCMLFYVNSLAMISKEISILMICNVLLCTLVYLVNGWALRNTGYSYEMKRVTIIIFFMYTVLTIGITSFVFRIIRGQEKIKREEEEKTNLLEYTREVESLYEELRSFKHDYVNILVSLSGYIENKDMKGLEQYFEQNILPTNEKMNQGKYYLQKLSHILDPAIKGLVSSKMIYAMNAGLDVFIDIVENIDDIAIRTLDLTRILGIYIDNAIESAMESEQKQLKFHIVKEESIVIIVVLNSFVNHNLSVKEMEKQNVSTKGEGRGLGLHNVNEILLKYSNINKITEMKDGYFSQTLVIRSVKR